MNEAPPIADIACARIGPAELAANFADVHPPLDRHEALVEADRCYFCYDAPCMTACPTSIDIPLFIREIQAGNPTGAAKTILQSNILGGMCARVCPTETLCEEVCVREVAEGKPVRIGLLQRHATDHLMTRQGHPFTRAAPTGKSIAVVGAGPAGLSCAHRLAMLGHAVTIFDARQKAGGLNEFGIAAYKTTDDYAQREVDFVLGIGGISVETGKMLGRDIQLEDLREDFDAVFLGMGLVGVNALNVEDETAAGSLDAVDWIAALRQSGDVGTVPVGRRVVVIGGGMTAIDAAIQARALGADEVTVAYRRGQGAMNASRYEQELAQTRCVSLRLHLQPVKILTEQGRVTGVVFARTMVEDGRLVVTDERVTIEADQVFKAIGQAFLPVGVEGAIALEAGRIKVDAERRTSLAGVWAGGDCAAGGEDLTVVAVEDGKVAAMSIHEAMRAPAGLAARIAGTLSAAFPSLSPRAV